MTADEYNSKLTQYYQKKYRISYWIIPVIILIVLEDIFLIKESFRSDYSAFSQFMSWFGVVLFPVSVLCSYFWFQRYFLIRQLGLTCSSCGTSLYEYTPTVSYLPGIPMERVERGCCERCGHPVIDGAQRISTITHASSLGENPNDSTEKSRQSQSIGDGIRHRIGERIGDRLVGYFALVLFLVILVIIAIGVIAFFVFQPK